MSVWARRIFQRILGRFCFGSRENLWSRGWNTGFYRFYHPSQFFWGFLQIKRDRPFGFEGAHHVGPHFFQYIAPLLVNLPLTWFRLKLGDISKLYFLESDNTPLDVGWFLGLVPHKKAWFHQQFKAIIMGKWWEPTEATGFLGVPSLTELSWLQTAKNFSERQQSITERQEQIWEAHQKNHSFE